MASIARRSALCLPLLLAAPARAAPAIPPFPHWVGRTARVRGDGLTARLLLAEDGTGLMTVRMMLLCRALPIRGWHMAEEGMAVRYSRVSARDPARLIVGEARILAERGKLLWIEASPHTADFEGFAETQGNGSCR